MGYRSIQNKHCLIIKDCENKDHFIAVGVGEVANIEGIAEQDFEDLPNLDFPFNEYFDKAYIKDSKSKCTYRLKNLAFLEQNNNDN